MADKYEQRDMSASCFINDRKEDERHADFTGKGMVFGRMVYVNIWEKKTKNDDDWFSISFKEITPQGGGRAPSSKAPVKAPPRNDFDQTEQFQGSGDGADIPF